MYGLAGNGIGTMAGMNTGMVIGHSPQAAIVATMKGTGETQGVVILGYQAAGEGKRLISINITY